MHASYKSHFSNVNRKATPFCIRLEFPRFGIVATAFTVALLFAYYYHRELCRIFFVQFRHAIKAGFEL